MTTPFKGNSHRDPCWSEFDAIVSTVSCATNERCASVGREDFLKNYQGSELDPRWLNRVSKLAAKGWQNFVAVEKDKIKDMRQNIQELAALPGRDSGEFRKSVNGVPKGER